MLLEFQGLTKSYGGTVALDNLSFSVSSGVLFGFLGPNGAGKTTAMRTVLNLVALDRGEVLLDGVDVREHSSVKYGYLPEERGLYPKMSVFDHLVYIARLHGIDRKEAEKRANTMIEMLDIKPDGKSKVEALSLGNQQRCQIAATLIHDPEVLILDEPFSGLDPMSVDVIKELLMERARQGRIVLFSSHQLEVVEDLCESVAIINNGHLVLNDTTEHITSLSERLVIQVREDPEGTFLENVKEFKIVDKQNGVLHVKKTSDDINDDDLLRLGLACGTILRYDHERRSLAGVFREAIVRDNIEQELVLVQESVSG